MSPNPPATSLHDLLARLADGELSQQEAVALEILLQNSPENRAHYRTFLAVHLALQETFQADNPIPFPAPAPSPKVWFRVVAAAAAVALLSGVFIWHATRPASGPSTAEIPDAALATGPVLAVVACAEDVAWNLPQPAQAGVKLPASLVTLGRGELVLTLANGQTLALRGPASFRLRNDMQVDLHAGQIAVKQESAHGMLVVRVPKGAVVCSEGEFSLQCLQGGQSLLHVFAGATSVSTVDGNSRSREEAIVTKDQSLEIGERLVHRPIAADTFIRVPRALPTTESIADAAYAAAVVADQPVAFWRFEETNSKRHVPATRGEQPLDLRGNATLAGPPGRRFLAVDNHQRSGFAYSENPVATLSGAGFTLECLVFSASEEHASAVILESATNPPPASGPLKHAPQLCAIERMGRMGEHIGHIHPDYALRAVIRFPGDYQGGTNLYSTKSHLLHSWHHAALAFDGSVMRLYLDGQLTDEAVGGFKWDSDLVRVVVGRLQPMPQGDLRQWIGGIDEVAIYSRPLPAAAILRHYEALRNR